MADNGDRTEAPTPQRRTEARRQGQVARSQDLSAAVLLLVGLITLQFIGRRVLIRLFDITQYCLGSEADGIHTPSHMLPLASRLLEETVTIVLPLLLGLFVASGLVALMQTGWLFTTEPVKPDLNKINPIKGFKKLFSMHLLTQTGINLGKLVVVGAVVASAIWGELDRILFMATLTLGEILAVGVDLFFTIGIRVGIALLLLGLIDWWYQRFRHEKDLKMSKQEVKDEMRRMEGDPVMKRRRRQTQYTLAMQRLRRDVPQADVVVTNPTHLAIALKYDAETMRAPRVVAKGEDYMALRIREMAVAAGVPIVERKPLARALYGLAEVGEEIPEQFYTAVAEILAYVYRLSGRSRAG